MSAITQLLCNKFGGIRHKNSVFSDELITAQDIQNVELYYTGSNGGVGIRTMKGNTPVIELPNEKVIDIFQSVQQRETLFLIYTENANYGKFYLYKDGELTLKKDNIQKSGVCNGFDVAQGYSDLFFFTNGKEMFTFELGATTEIVEMNNLVSRLKYDGDADYQIVKGFGATIFDNRLFIFNKNVLFWSVRANIYDFSTNNSDWTTSAGYLECTKNITAIHEYLGSLAVFYKDSSQLLTVSDNNFSLGEDSPGGCASYNSLVFHGTDLYFYDDTKKGVFAFQQVVNGDKTLSDNLAVDIQEELISIDSSNLDKIRTLSVVLSERNEIWWVVPTNDSYYSKILIYDYLKGEWVKRKSQKINSVKVINNQLYSAGDTKVYKEYSSDLFDNEYIPHYYNCSPCNLGAYNTLKVLVFPPRVSFDLPYLNKFKVKYIKNCDTSKKPKIKLIKPKYKNLLIWGQGIWGQDYWKSKSTNAVGKFPNANFKILEIEIYTDSKNQNFSIKNIEFSKIKIKQV